jgi:hypothetical protein
MRTEFSVEKMVQSHARLYRELVPWVLAEPDEIDA